jgi:hypothetical protein
MQLLAPTSDTEEGQSHGTVNVILANSNGLVAVTDSMVTRGSGVDPKLETLKIGTNCSERRFGCQPGYSVWSFAVPLPSGS